MYEPSSKTLRPAFTIAALGLAASLLAGCAGQASNTALPSIAPQSAAHGNFAPSRAVPDAGYTFTTLDDDADPTFNQLLGINTKGTIAGYFGSGATGHPNKGYTLVAPYGQGNYTNENFPNSAQTQVTCLNNKKDTAGFWADANGDNFGFVEWNGVFTSYKDPKTGKGTVNQILGINDSGLAVGFYTNAAGVNFGYEIEQGTTKYIPITPPSGTNVTASGINDLGDVVGFYTGSSGVPVSFLYKNKAFTEFSFPNAVSTTALGVNEDDEIVGVYVDGSNLMHGFVLKNLLTKAKFTSVDDPNGVGTTTINGLNDKGDLVGFYVDSTGNTDGFLAVP